METHMSKKIVLVSFEWIIYLCLAILAIYSTTGVLKDYAKRKTSMGVDILQPLTSHPHIAVCFNDVMDGSAKDTKMFDLITQVNITYIYTSEQPGLILREGENLLPKSDGESIVVKRGIKCYMLESKTKTFQAPKGKARTIKVEFNQNLKADELPIKLYFMATSEVNSYGLEYGTAYEGKPDVNALFLNEKIHIEFEVNKFLYLSDVGDGCEVENFWDLVESAFVKEMENFCPVLCRPTILPSGLLDPCLLPYDYVCAASVLQKAVNEKLAVFKSPCQKIEYKGVFYDIYNIEGLALLYSVDNTGNLILDPYKLQFQEHLPTVMYTYKFEIPEAMTVYEEYLVTSFEDMIGIVGGTLGVYIGFVCFDNCMAFVDYLIMFGQKIATLRKRKVSDKNLAKIKEKPKVTTIKNERDKLKANKVEDFKHMKPNGTSSDEKKQLDAKKKMEPNQNMKTNNPILNTSNDNKPGKERIPTEMPMIIVDVDEVGKNKKKVTTNFDNGSSNTKEEFSRKPHHKFDNAPGNKATSNDIQLTTN